MTGRPLDGGWLWMRRGRIVAMGAGAPPRGGRATVDLGDAIVMPGLVNAHTHLEFSAEQTPLDASGGLPGWLGRVVAIRRGRGADAAGEARVVAAIAAGMAESAAHGVTALGEIATSAPAGAHAAAGPRVRVFREALGLGAAAAQAALRDSLRDEEALARRGLATGFSPHAPYSVAASLGTAIIAAARRRRLPVAMHLAESDAEAELAASGSGPFRDLLESLGAWNAALPPVILPAAEWITRLARAPRGIVVHGTHLARDGEALTRLGRHRDRLCVAVCPRTTLAISGTPPPVRLFHDAGVRVAIGTDSRASSPDLSVLAECRTLVNAGLAVPEAAVRMATVDGAWALGFERTAGVLAAGRPADLVILRTATTPRDPFEAILDPATSIAATVRAGRVIAGTLE